MIKLQKPTHQTKTGSKNCITITNPNVTRISPKLIKSIKQQTPFGFGQKGFGADIASILAPRNLCERPLLPVLAVLATEYTLRGPPLD